MERFEEFGNERGGHIYDSVFSPSGTQNMHEVNKWMSSRYKKLMPKPSRVEQLWGALMRGMLSPIYKVVYSLGHNVRSHPPLYKHY